MCTVVSLVSIVRMKALTFVGIVVALSNAKTPCQPRDFGHGSVVCLCTADYCDTLEPLGPIPNNKFYHLVSSQDGERFEVSYGEIGNHSLDLPDVVIRINKTETFQKILGFGGAFTDSTALNLAVLSKDLQRQILKAYYGKNGLEYNLGRTNMGSCDFSSRLYSYDDVEGDVSLDHFALVEEDNLKIRYIKEAQKLNPDIKLFASPWTAPKWMKTNNQFFGQGSLRTEFYPAWATYFVKFLEEYEKLGVQFWAVTAQNEPLDGILPNFSFNCMGWTPGQQRDWIKNNLGPTLASSKFNQTKIIILDDQRPLIVIWARAVLRDPDAAKYISGIGLHWYGDIYPPTILEQAHKEFPEYFLLGTEACIGSNPLEEAVLLGSWNRAERYASDIIQDLNHWVTGWTDWNLVLDLEGGPNWAGNTVDAPIIVDNVTDRAYKQPMYYALGHFSKFIPRDSVRIGFESEDSKGLHVLAVQRPDNVTVLVILNQNDVSISVAIQDSQNKRIEVSVGQHSLHTIAY
ncbi:unnamed protein product [Allacma fusca]|uniref:Glucosylceramidase n=1 Tax=Allacma fusca TaxID=39272 RepID=A0A8J2PWK4_9HEXA|nr:unnamed protein product [Allacma fusca]